MHRKPIHRIYHQCHRLQIAKTKLIQIWIQNQKQMCQMLHHLVIVIVVQNANVVSINTAAATAAAATTILR